MAERYETQELFRRKEEIIKVIRNITSVVDLARLEKELNVIDSKLEKIIAVTH